MDILNTTIDLFKSFFNSGKELVTTPKQQIAPPESLVFFLTSECNMRCKQCYMWMNKDDNLISLERKMELIREYQKMNPNGNVTLIGGEPMLKEKEFFAIFKLCRELNLKSGVETNGTLINESHYKKLILEGPNVLGISLDSHIDQIHDRIRGVKGSCEQLKKTLTDLVAYKKNNYPNENFRLFTVSILFNENIEYVHDYIDFAKNIGIDGVGFLPLFPTFGNKKKDKDIFYENSFFQDRKKATKILDELAERTKSDKFLFNTYKDFQWMKFYVENADNFEEALEKPICASHWHRIIVKHDGEYELCGNMRGIEGLEKESIGNAKNISLEEFWKSSKAKYARTIMDECKLPCGVVFCNHKRPTN